jgi:hypothetical protein
MAEPQLLLTVEQLERKDRNDLPRGLSIRDRHRVQALAK